MNQIHGHSCFKKGVPLARESCFKTAHQGTPLRERSVKVNVGGKAKVGGKVKVGGKCLGDWHLPPTVYFPCASPKFSLFEWTNH